jgi:hypothetical protein
VAHALKPSASTEDVPAVVSETLRVGVRSSRETLRLRNHSPVLPSRNGRSTDVSDVSSELVNWAKEAALAHDRSLEVASMLHKEAFVFGEVRRSAPEQLLASLMGVTGLKAGECLALTNAMGRLLPDFQDYTEGKEMCSN